MEEDYRVHSENDARDWHDSHQLAAGPSGTTQTPTAQRRRSSAAHTRPILPPPNLPIPNLPSPSLHLPTNGHPTLSNGVYEYPHLDSPPQPSSYLNGNGQAHRSGIFARQTASPSLAAVAAFPTYASTSQNLQLSATSSVDDLSDPPPPSILPNSSRVQSSDDSDDHNHLAPPTSDPRPPSSRRALTRALELAREAVTLDSSNDDPQAAVMAYGRSVALLSEVMERVRRGEDTTEPRRRNGRRRNSVAQEEEVRRLQRIHDTYADRMNILSIVYSIPPMPYTGSAADANATDSAKSTSPSSSVSGTSETSDSIPTAPYTNHTQDNQHEDRTSLSTGAEAIGAAMFMDLPSPVRPMASAVSAHPYANTQLDPPTLHPGSLSPPANRASMQIRRSRATSAALPPALPPPANSPPPAPDSPTDVNQGSKQHLEVVTRQRGDSIGHRRTGSGSKLEALEEERYDDYTEADIYEAEVRTGSRLMDSRATHTDESPPLPALPLSANGPGTPRTTSSLKPSSPRAPPLIAPRPRGSSQASPLPENVLINASINQGTISQRRLKSSAPPTPRSSSPSDSVASVGSYPRSIASSLPASSAGSVGGASRSRSSSQPGRRPSLVGGGGSPTQELPPLPSHMPNGVVTQRKSSYPSKLTPFSQAIQLTVQTEFPPNSTYTPPLNAPPPIFSNALPITPVSPLPPSAPADPLRKPYHLMNLLRATMTSTTGGYITRRLHVPQEVWSQGGAKLNNLPEKVRVVGILCSALEDLQNSSSDHFGAGNVSSGMALGIGSIGRKEGEAWLSKLEDFSSVCDGVVANFGKKLGVGEGFVLKKTTWGDKLGRRFDKYINGKNLDSPAAYVQGLRRLFIHAQLLDEHTKAISSVPVAPAYAAFPVDIRQTADLKLKRCSEFFATVVLTFVIRDLSQLLDKYAKKCEKWLAE